MIFWVRISKHLGTKVGMRRLHCSSLLNSTLTSLNYKSSRDTNLWAEARGWKPCNTAWRAREKRARTGNIEGLTIDVCVFKDRRAWGRYYDWLYWTEKVLRWKGKRERLNSIESKCLTVEDWGVFVFEASSRWACRAQSAELLRAELKGTANF